MTKFFFEFFVFISRTSKEKYSRNFLPNEGTSSTIFSTLLSIFLEIFLNFFNLLRNFNRNPSEFHLNVRIFYNWIYNLSKILRIFLKIKKRANFPKIFSKFCRKYRFYSNFSHIFSKGVKKFPLAPEDPSDIKNNFPAKCPVPLCVRREGGILKIINQNNILPILKHLHFNYNFLLINFLIMRKFNYR